MSKESTPPNWVRPTDVPFPNIWLKENGYVIRDVTPDLQPYVIEHMRTYYVEDEPCLKATNVHNDPKAIEDLCRLWKEIAFPHNISIVALAEGTPGADLKPVGPENPPNILGVNLLIVSHKNDSPFPPVQELTTATSLQIVFNATFYDISKEIDNIFEKYNIDHYLDASGLSVHPDSRGKGLGLLILRARLELCRGLRIPLTKTVFTSIQAQKVAEKAGFKLIYEKKYDEFVNKDGEKIFINMEPSKTIQVRVHVINN